MAENTQIEWADHTFNPWEGCQKVSPACDNCYAEERNIRFNAGMNWGPGRPRRRTSAANWNKPLRWQANAADFFEDHGRRQRVFCASLADVFDNAVDPAWRRDLFKLIDQCPDLDWMLLTKRIGNAQGMLSEHYPGLHLPSNIWVGATIANQEEADRDIPKLLNIPSRVRFLSMEPLLGRVQLEHIPIRAQGVDFRVNVLQRSSEFALGVDWVITGGESGPKARPVHPDWIRLLRDQCARANVPFLFKQWGEWLPIFGRYDQPPERVVVGGQTYSKGSLRLLADGTLFIRTGKHESGRLLFGETYTEFPLAQLEPTIR